MFFGTLPGSGSDSESSMAMANSILSRFGRLRPSPPPPLSTLPILGVRTPSQTVGRPLLGNTTWPVLTVTASTQLILGSFRLRDGDAGVGIVGPLDEEEP